MTFPFTATFPSRIRVSAARRDAMPARARMRLSLSPVFLDHLRH